MASRIAHESTGWAAGLIAAALVANAGAAGPWHAWCIAAVIMGYLGGTAPDTLEIAWWRKGHHLWITHRTWTHWGIMWIAGLIASYHYLGKTPVAALALGFTCGGLMHLLADWVNPMGIPWITMRRHSLNWWRSGRCDRLVILAAWIPAILAIDQVWFNGEGRHRLMALARQLPDVASIWMAAIG